MLVAYVNSCFTVMLVAYVNSCFTVMLVAYVNSCFTVMLVAYVNSCFTVMLVHQCHCTCSPEIGTCMINDTGRQVADKNNENKRFILMF
jgi:hypothetical protein